MKRRALGKGLEAIISNKSIVKSNLNSQEINISEIFPNPEQPRKNFKKEEIQKLAESIKEAGLIQPVVLTKKGDHYLLVVGERRWRAAQALKWEKIPAIIKDLSSDEIIISALSENIQREDLNSVEVAEGIKALMQETGLNQENVAQKLGLNRTTVTNFLRLLKLPEIIKKSIIDGEISQGHARALVSLSTIEDIMEAFSNIKHKKLSVREAENLVKRYQKGIKNKPVKMDPDINKMENDLIKLFSTKVKLKYSKTGKGKIEIFFQEIEEFQRIYKILSRSQNAK